MKLGENILSQFPCLLWLVNHAADFGGAASEACSHVFVDCWSQGENIHLCLWCCERSVDFRFYFIKGWDAKDEHVSFVFRFMLRLDLVNVMNCCAARIMDFVSNSSTSSRIIQFAASAPVPHVELTSQTLCQTPDNPAKYSHGQKYWQPLVYMSEWDYEN